MKILFLVFVSFFDFFSQAPFAQDKKSSPVSYPVVKQEGSTSTQPVESKQENKIDFLYRISHFNIFDGLARDIFVTDLEEKKDSFPKDLWPLIREAGEMTQKDFYFEEQIKKSLHASLSLNEIEEIEHYFNDPKIKLILDTLHTLREEHRTDVDKEAKIAEFLKSQTINTPRRSLLYLIDSEIYRLGECSFILAKLEAQMKFEVESLDVSKKRKSELASKIKKELEVLSLTLLEKNLDKESYYYQKIETSDLKYLYLRTRSGAVFKFYQTIHLSASDSFQLLGKKFEKNLRELYRAKTRPKI
jgi:hypothetical protein